MRLSAFYQSLLLVLVVLGVYYPTMFAPLNSLDDQVFINQLLNQDGFSWSRLFAPGGTHNYFRPFLLLTFQIDKYIGGLQEPFMHLLNILVHLVNVLLVWGLARRFGAFVGVSSHWLSFVAALLFAVHPVNTEAVNWILGRTDLLAGTFVLCSLYALIVFLEKCSVSWGVISALALLAGALCKETALFVVPAAVFLLFYNLNQNQKSWRFRWILPLLYSGSVGVYFLLRWGAFQTDRGLGHTAKLASQMVGVYAPAAAQTPVAAPFSWLDALITVLKVSGFYAMKLIQPLPLNFAINHVSIFYLVPGIILLVGLLVCAVRRHPVGWMFLVSASVAVSALLVVFVSLAWTPVAERYMYIPSALFVIGCVFSVGRHIKRPAEQQLAGVLVFSILVFWGWQTADRNVVWQDNLTLYQDTVRKSPDFAPAKNQLALALQKHGRAEDAAEILANNEMPVSGLAAVNVAVAFAEGGDYEAAKNDLLGRLHDADDYQKAKILEKLIQLTDEYGRETQDEKLIRAVNQEVVGWLKQIREMSPTGFNYYRVGRMQIFLGNKAAAKAAFAEAAKRLSPDSIYFKPATKLATDLAE